MPSGGVPKDLIDELKAAGYQAGSIMGDDDFFDVLPKNSGPGISSQPPTPEPDSVIEPEDTELAVGDRVINTKSGGGPATVSGLSSNPSKIWVTYDGDGRKSAVFKSSLQKITGDAAKVNGSSLVFDPLTVDGLWDITDDYKSHKVESLSRS